MLPFGLIGDVAGKLLEKIFPDKAERDKARALLLAEENAAFFKELELQASVVVAEAKSQYWLTANWRPLMMMIFGTIVANNYILYPYLSLFWDAAPALELPPDMWQVIKIGLGGYVVGRSGEKIAVSLTKNK